MSIKREPSEWQAKPSITQKVREKDLTMQDVADTIEAGELVHDDPAEGYAVVEGEVEIGIMSQQVRLHLSTDEEPMPQINRMEIINE